VFSNSKADKWQGQDFMEIFLYSSCLKMRSIIAMLACLANYKGPHGG